MGDGRACLRKSCWVSAQKKEAKGNFGRTFKIPYSLTSLRQCYNEEVIMQLLQVELVLLN